MATAPNLFVVGAAKCGTTSMHAMLAAHPDVFMCRPKEPRFLGRDLDLPSWFRLDDESAYLELFRDGAGFAHRGDASPTTMLSSQCVEEVKAFAPDPRVIVMLRHPVDMLASLHAQVLRSGRARHRSLDAAWRNSRSEDEPLLDAGQGSFLNYRRWMRLGTQVERLRSELAPHQLHVVLLEDLTSDVGGVMAGVWRFLELEPVPAVPASRNPHRRVRSLAVQRLLRQDGPLGRLRRRSPRMGRRLESLVRGVNVVVEPRPALDPGLRRRLARELEPVVGRLERCLDRDLAHWRR